MNEKKFNMTDFMWDFFPHFHNFTADMGNGFNPEEFRTKVNQARQHRVSALQDKSILQDRGVVVKLNSLNHIPEGRFSVDMQDDFHYECVFIPNPNSKKLMVVLGGAFTKNTKFIPQCNMWSWTKMLDVNYLYIEDPMYYRHKNIPLTAWYLDSEDEIIRKGIASLIHKVAGILSIKSSDIILEGVSAGGTGAIAVGAYCNSLYGMNVGVMAQNPQLDFSIPTADIHKKITGCDVPLLSQKEGSNDLCAKMQKSSSCRFVILFNLNSLVDATHLKYIVDYFHITAKLGLNVCLPNLCLIIYTANHWKNGHDTWLRYPLINVPLWLLSVMKNKAVNINQFEHLILFFNEMYYKEYSYLSENEKLKTQVKSLEEQLTVASKNDKQTMQLSINNLDIFTDSGLFDGSKVATFLKSLLQCGELEKFDAYVDLIKESEVFVNSRIDGYVGIISQQKQSLLSQKQLADKNPLLFQTLLRPYDTSKKLVNSFANITSLPPGRYMRQFPDNIRFSSFEEDFKDLSNADKQFLKERGFAKVINSHYPDVVRVIRNARIHVWHNDFLAVSDEDGYFDQAESARVASLTNINYLHSGKTQYLDKAIILSIPVAAVNYYHLVSENFGALRLLSDFNNDSIPIVFAGDRFDIVDFIADRLNCDRSRFISMQDLSHTVIGTAFQICKSSYAYSSGLVSFFRKISYPQTQHHKVYVSRRKSKRSFSNELELENHLKRLGFRIVFAEDLTFEQQVHLFSNTDLLVTSHGAAITNILFMPDKTSLIELFNFEGTYVKGDYYYRSRHKQMKYKPVICKDNVVDIQYVEYCINEIMQGLS